MIGRKFITLAPFYLPLNASKDKTIRAGSLKKSKNHLEKLEV